MPPAGLVDFKPLASVTPLGICCRYNAWCKPNLPIEVEFYRHDKEYVPFFGSVQNIVLLGDYVLAVRPEHFVLCWRHASRWGR